MKKLFDLVLDCGSSKSLYMLAFRFFSSTISSQRAFYHFCKSRKEKEEKSSLCILCMKIICSSQWILLKVILAIKWCNQNQLPLGSFKRVKKILSQYLSINITLFISLVHVQPKMMLSRKFIAYLHCKHSHRLYSCVDLRYP